MFNFIRKWWIRRQYRISKENAMTDEIREKGLAIRRQQAQINQLSRQVEMKQQLQVLEQALAGGDNKKSNFEEQIALAILSKFINPAPAIQQQVAEKENLSDEQIETFIRQNGYLVKNIAELGLTETEIRQEIRQKAPQLADETIDRSARIFLQHVKEVET